MVGDAVLREVIGADLLAAIAGADLRLALLRHGGSLLFLLDLVKTRTQDAHTFFTVLYLRFFVLAADHGAGWNMRDAHGGICGVHGLSAGTRGAESIDAQIFGFDLDIDILGFGQHGNRDGGSVNAPLGLGLRNALHAMHAAFVFQFRIRALAFDQRNNLFKPADAGLGTGEDLHLPSLLFGEATVE